ncbi:MAG TPA: cytochrome c [Thermoanaerobaculia bacterium]|nr:cytochrome c [Thermoanaerobaculia bacterium]
MRHRSPVVAGWVVAGCLLAGFAAAACRGGDESTDAGLYRRHCARCHGLDGAGNPRAVGRQPGLDLTRPEVLAEGRDEIRRRIVEGEGTMPAFGEKLTREQIDRLVALTEHLAAGGEIP